MGSGAVFKPSGTGYLTVTESLRRNGFLPVMTVEDKAVAEYVAEVARLAKTGKTTEHSFRGALAALIDALAPGDNVVDAVRWEAARVPLPRCEASCRGSGALAASSPICRVYINPTQYFDNVPITAWEQAIGGYHPAEKWLKDRKGRALTQDDLRHYQRIILALVKTRKVMERIT